jgi:hypothetical protein
MNTQETQSRVEFLASVDLLSALTRDWVSCVFMGAAVRSASWLR